MKCRVADEVRLHATLLELGRSGQQQGLRNIWAAICSASKQELSADDLQVRASEDMVVFQAFAGPVQLYDGNLLV